MLRCRRVLAPERPSHADKRSARVVEGGSRRSVQGWTRSLRLLMPDRMRLLVLWCSCGVQLLSGLGGNQNIKSINVGAVSGLGGNRFAAAEYQEGNELICQFGRVACRLPGLVPAVGVFGSDRFAVVANQNCAITTNQWRVR